MPDVPAPKYQRATWLVELNGTWVTYLEYLYAVENGLSDGLILLTQGKGRLRGHTYTHRSLADAGRDFVCCLFGGGGLGGANRSDIGLNLSGSWQQGHSATYNTPSRI